LCSPQLGSVEERLQWKREIPLRSSLGSPASWYSGTRPGKAGGGATLGCGGSLRVREIGRGGGGGGGTGAGGERG
jgi:hypothetical protein